MDFHVSKMNPGNNGIITELVEKQEKIQIHNKHENTTFVNLYMLNKMGEKSGGNGP